jgi:3',5'-cyclic-AMP phosphodiesterase
MKRVAYITDLHLDEDASAEKGIDPRINCKRILEDVVSKNINEIICGGDIGTKESYPWFFDLIKDFKVDLTPGNHDLGSEVIKYYGRDKIKSTGELYYSYVDQYYRYIFMDSSSGEISEQQFQWMKGELITSQRLVLFIHHPVLEIKTAIDQKYPLHGREQIKQVLQSSRSEVTIFCGHYHMNDEQTNLNIKQVVTPSASFQIVKNASSIEIDTSSFGYRIITLEQEGLTSEVLMYKDGSFTSE